MGKVLYVLEIGSSMYIMVRTRLDIDYVVIVVCQIKYNQGIEHWEGVKCLVCYLKGISEAALCFRRK